MREPYENIKTISSKLVGSKVQVLVSEPWDFAEEFRAEKIIAIIEQIFIQLHIRTDEFKEHESILLRVLEPFGYKKMKFEYLLASPRHYGDSLQELSKGGNIPFNFLRIPEVEAKSNDLFQAGKNWRGGPEGLIGSLLIMR